MLFMVIIQNIIFVEVDGIVLNSFLQCSISHNPVCSHK